LALDPAVVTDKVNRHTGVQFDGFAIDSGDRAGQQVAVITIRPASAPMVFAKPGNYLTADNKQKSAFAQGTLPSATG
jgi:hypothetical protein